MIEQHSAIVNLLQQDAFDTIIVPGYGPVLPGRALAAGRLTIYGRINALAAGMLCEAYHPHNMIISGGRTGGNDKPSEAELIAEYIQLRFNIMNAAMLVEDQATNTILNFVYTANIIDKAPGNFGPFLVVAMGFHLPRIREICSLVNMNAHYVAAEDIVRLRSHLYSQLLGELLDPARESYAKTLRDQESFLRALKDIPEYWLPQIAEITSIERLRDILATERIQSFLQARNIEAATSPLELLQNQLRSIPRQLPSLM